jgi:hypothetical protein
MKNARYTNMTASAVVLVIAVVGLLMIMKNESIVPHLPSGTSSSESGNVGGVLAARNNLTAGARSPIGPFEEVPLFGVFEVTLTATGDYFNPYLQMPGDNNAPGFVVATFTGPNDETISVDGFWDSGQTWKIRMSPAVTGTWTYTTSSTDSGLDGRTGAFNCVSSDSRGFVRVDPDHPHHLKWDDGTPFYWASVAIGWGRCENCNTRVDDGTFQSFLDVRAGQGFNHTWWGYTGFEKPNFNDHNQKNEGGDVFVNYDPDLPNPSFHSYLDQRIEAVVNRGFLAQIRLGWPDQNILGNIGHTRLKRYWRYLIARYAAYNVEWNLFGEVQEFGSDYLAIYLDYADLTRRWDPYDHLLSTHTVGDLAPEFARQSSLDYITLQRPTSTTSDYLVYGKPVLNAEYGGYEDAGPPGGTDPDTIRRMIWDIRMRGGYFVYETWGTDLQSPGALYSQLNNKFFQNRTRFWLLEHHPELFDTESGLADPGREYVVYLPDGNDITVDLSQGSGTFTVEWFNPRTGETMTMSPVAGGTPVTYTAPDNKDWVLHIYPEPHDLDHIYLPLVTNQGNS